MKGIRLLIEFVRHLVKIFSSNFFDSRPWGYYRTIDQWKNAQVKTIVVKPGKRLSLQTHKSRAEVWIVVDGEGERQTNDFIHPCSRGDVVSIPVETPHRIKNTHHLKDLVFVEVALGYHDKISENDIVRLEDDYGRS